MFARVGTSGVVLDTVCVNTASPDSCPCVSIYQQNKVYVTYQSNGQVKARLLEYPAGDANRPPDWSAALTVTSNGFHPMSVIEGDFLQCVWSANSQNNHLVRKGYLDLAQGGSWSSPVTVSEQDTVTRANPVYAGVGCYVWQQLQDGRWVIRARARDSLFTLVSSDTDAYHPQAGPAACDRRPVAGRRLTGV